MKLSMLQGTIVTIKNNRYTKKKYIHLYIYEIYIKMAKMNY